MQCPKSEISNASPNTTKAQGNGALCSAPPNFNRPRTKQIFEAFGKIASCHTFVSGLAGINKTIVELCFLFSSIALLINFICSLP